MNYWMGVNSQIMFENPISTGKQHKHVKKETQHTHKQTYASEINYYPVEK